jgi:hypothetical protein
LHCDCDRRRELVEVVKELEVIVLRDLARPHGEASLLPQSVAAELEAVVARARVRPLGNHAGRSVKLTHIDLEGLTVPMEGDLLPALEGNVECDMTTLPLTGAFESLTVLVEEAELRSRS